MVGAGSRQVRRLLRQNLLEVEVKLLRKFWILCLDKNTRQNEIGEELKISGKAI